MRTAEQIRLEEARQNEKLWKMWGPYLTERQWGTVREDYSDNGDAWNFFTHEQARSRAYRWGEDGLGGICDEKQRLCLALALWNGKDAILKERLFGLTNSEANHGEDVKEYYFYIDSTPTHSYMKYLYKYPQAAFPYADLVETNRRRSRNEMEYELLDTGLFDQDRYFDVFMEYAKDGPDDILVQITAVNRGPEQAELHLLPTLWFRNDWATWIAGPAKKPILKQIQGPTGTSGIVAQHSTLGTYHLYCEGKVPLLFAENETNNARLFPQYPNPTPYVKDGINDYVVHGRKEAVNPAHEGTKASAHYRQMVGPGQSMTVRLRLTSQGSVEQGKDKKAVASPFGPAFAEIFAARLKEADEFYRSVTPPSVSPDAANVMRQALAGMLWSKQYYYFDGNRWLEEHHSNPLHAGYRNSRNSEWFHMVNEDIISMPDKWEYPWYAAWDLAFHTLPLSIVDPDFAKQQMNLMLHGLYLHPNGQVPAYEWNFSDVNPPVHAFATLFLHRTEQALRGETDVNFLKSAFNKLLLNFTWWVNRKDRFGKNVFEGGFLGPGQHRRVRPKRSVADGRSPRTGGRHSLDGPIQPKHVGTCGGVGALRPHLRGHGDKIYRTLLIYCRGDEQARAGGHVGRRGRILLRSPATSGRQRPAAQGSLDGGAAALVRHDGGGAVAAGTRSAGRRGVFARSRQMPELMKSMHPTGPGHFGVNERGIIALINPERLRRILSKMLDENEFLGPYGLRALSKFHERNPYIFNVGGQEYRVNYLPAESDTGMFGGNSNWRGPVWMPVNVILIRALLNYYLYYGDNFKIECPTGSGKMMNLFEVAKEIADRLSRIFLRDERGRRPVYGGTQKFQSDPHWRDLILFYEFFHGDNGAGLGASHQTGWTGCVAKTIQLFGLLDPKRVLEGGKKAAFKQGDV